MTTIDIAPASDPAPVAPPTAVTFDLYRDIHKAIRVVFTLTTSVGRTDPADATAGDDLCGRVVGAMALLEAHAQHEDRAIDPHLQHHLPDLAQAVVTDHLAFEHRGALLVELARSAAEASGPDRRRLVHLLYLDLAAFTSGYLAHQDLEERVIMPRLEAVLGVPAVIDVHHEILGAIPPEELTASLSLMIPAMNVEDRTEMLGGMRAEAPAEVFAGVWALADSVLPSADVAALASRLGLP